jgi:hypothetical protein
VLPTGHSCGNTRFSKLKSCKAFRGKDYYCSKCGHHWQQHLHVLYEQQEKTVTEKSGFVEEQLEQNTTDITLKRAMINGVKTEIKECEYEYREI